MKANLRAPSWIVAVSTAALGLVYLFVFFLPNQRAIDELSDQLSAKQAFVAQVGSISTTLDSTRGRLERTQAYNTAWEASAPGEVELAALFGQINELANASGAKATRFDPEPAECMDGLRRVPVVLGCTGSFAQIANFLCDLESLPRMIWVDRLVCDASGDNGELVEFKLTLTIFADNPDDSDQVDLAG